MRNITREQIKKLFDDPQGTMENGLWFSGYTWGGEYKQWHNNGQLWIHCFYKDGEREGEYKRWWDNGKLQIQCFFKDGKENGEYKEWYESGQSKYHCLYKKGKIVRII